MPHRRSVASAFRRCRWSRRLPAPQWCSQTIELRQGSAFQLVSLTKGASTRAAGAIPAAGAVAVDLKAVRRHRDGIFELDEAALGMLQRGLDRDHHADFE